MATTTATRTPKTTTTMGESKKPTFTKAGPNSRSGGKSRGQNNATRPYTASELEKLRMNANRAHEDRVAARQRSVEMFQERQVQLASTMLTEKTGRDGKPLSHDTRMGASVLIRIFLTAKAVKENGQVVTSRTQVATKAAEQNMPEGLRHHPKRFKAVKAGFFIAQELLSDAYTALKAEQKQTA